MPKYIVKCRDHYAEWSTIVDAPTTRFMPLEVFKEYYRNEYGAYGMEALPERLARADATGCSSRDETWLQLLQGNRAGEDEDELSENQLWLQYGPEQP